MNCSRGAYRARPRNTGAKRRGGSLLRTAGKAGRSGVGRHRQRQWRRRERRRTSRGAGGPLEAVSSSCIWRDSPCSGGRSGGAYQMKTRRTPWLRHCPAGPEPEPPGSQSVPPDLRETLRRSLERFRACFGARSGDKSALPAGSGERSLDSLGSRLFKHSAAGHGRT